MSKWWYYKKKLRTIDTPFDLILELPGEPLIYSIKYDIASRNYKLNHFRNRKWFSMLRCYFDLFRPDVPVALVVTFYVSPPTGVIVKEKPLKDEVVPALHCSELCDYLLSFQEILHKNLLHSYMQVVEIKTRKLYSERPRTTFQIMRWTHYVEYQNNHTLDAESQGVREDREAQLVQSERQRDEACQGVCPQGRGRGNLPSITWAFTNSGAFHLSPSVKPRVKKKAKVPSKTPRKKAGQGQSGEVLE